MPLRPPVRFASITIAAVLIFTALIALQCAAQRFAQRRTTVQDVYAQLARAFTDAGVLPLGSLGEMRAGLSLLGAGELTALAGVPENVGAYGALDGRVRVFTGERGVVWIELEPAIWSKLPRDKAALTLKRIAHLDFYAQAGSARKAQGLRQLPQNFTFRVNGGAEQYDIAPLFEDDKCVTLRITRAR
jgi:hypothetical protein